MEEFFRCQRLKKQRLYCSVEIYDKVMAAYIIANGAAAYDHEVTVFHTFWGLNAMRKDEPIQPNKTLLEKMFGA